MKKQIIFLLFVLFTLIGCSGTKSLNKPKWFERDSRIEVVNESTVIFKDVLKIEIKTNDKNQVTYVYNLNHSKLVKVARGSFVVNLSRGNYLIQSDKRITKTIYEVVIE